MKLIYWVIYTRDNGITFYRDGSGQSSMGKGWIEPSTSIMMIIGGDHE